MYIQLKSLNNPEPNHQTTKPPNHQTTKPPWSISLLRFVNSDKTFARRTAPMLYNLGDPFNRYVIPQILSCFSVFALLRSSSMCWSSISLPCPFRKIKNENEKLHHWFKPIRRIVSSELFSNRMQCSHNTDSWVFAQGVLLYIRESNSNPSRDTVTLWHQVKK